MIVYLKVLAIEAFRFIAGLYLGFVWLPWHWWRTRGSR